MAEKSEVTVIPENTILLSLTTTPFGRHPATLEQIRVFESILEALAKMGAEEVVFDGPLKVAAVGAELLAMILPLKVRLPAIAAS
jgi:hypothetical protein